MCQCQGTAGGGKRRLARFRSDHHYKHHATVRRPMKLTLNVNARRQSVDAAPDTPLLYALRNDLGLDGPKFGCGMAQCGACTVHIDGVAVRSCITPVSAAVGKAVTTIEGLGTLDKPHRLQSACIAEQAGQCGYCLN